MRGVVTVCCLSFLLGLVAVVESDEDYTEDEEMILSLILQDDTQPEAESRPSAQFYRCTKVLITVWAYYLMLALKTVFFLTEHFLFFKFMLRERKMLHIT